MFIEWEAVSDSPRFVLAFRIRTPEDARTPQCGNTMYVLVLCAEVGALFDVTA